MAKYETRDGEVFVKQSAVPLPELERQRSDLIADKAKLQALIDELDTMIAFYEQ